MVSKVKKIAMVIAVLAVYLMGLPAASLAQGPTYMYWTDIGTQKIQRANLDGSGVTDLVTGLPSPIGIALDVAGGRYTG